MGRQRPSMVDVARAAGVSVATVSHTINRTRPVSDTARRKVLAAIEALDYSPDLFARGMRTGKKNLIGFIVPDISNNYFSQIIEKVEQVVSSNGYWLTIFNTQENETSELERLRYLTSGVVDGLLLASTLADSSQVEALLPGSFPVVLVDRKIHSRRYDTITIQSRDAVYRGVSELLQNGHARIGYVAGLQRLNTTQERLAAYEQAMDAHSAPIEPGFIQYGNSMAGSASACVERLLECGCTALVVSNGLMSIEAIEHLVRRGLRIGTDIDLLCFNDSAALPLELFPVGVVHQPVEELGTMAGRQIVERIQNITAPIRDVMLYCSYYPKPNSAPQGR